MFGIWSFVQTEERAAAEHVNKQLKIQHFKSSDGQWSSPAQTKHHSWIVAAVAECHERAPQLMHNLLFFIVPFVFCDLCSVAWCFCWFTSLQNLGRWQCLPEVRQWTDYSNQQTFPCKSSCVSQTFQWTHHGWVCRCEIQEELDHMQTKLLEKSDCKAKHELFDGIVSWGFAQLIDPLTQLSTMAHEIQSKMSRDLQQLQAPTWNSTLFREEIHLIASASISSLS